MLAGSQTSVILWSQWREKRSRHSRRMRTRNFTYLVRCPLGWIYIYMHLWRPIIVMNKDPYFESWILGTAAGSINISLGHLRRFIIISLSPIFYFFTHCKVIQQWTLVDYIYIYYAFKKMIHTAFKFDAIHHFVMAWKRLYSWLITGPLCGDPIDDRSIPLTLGKWCGYFHCC